MLKPILLSCANSAVWKSLFILFEVRSAQVRTSGTLLRWFQRMAKLVCRPGNSCLRRCVFHGPKVSAFPLLSEVQLCDLERAVAESHFQSISNTQEVLPKKVESAGEISKQSDVQPMEVDITVLPASATNNNFEMSVTVCKISHENNEPTKAVANFEQIKEVP